MKETKETINILVPVEKKQYYNADIIISLLKEMNKGQGMIVFQKGEEHIMQPLENLKDLNKFYKVMKLMISKNSKVDEELVDKFEKGLEDLKKGKFKRVR